MRIRRTPPFPALLAGLFTLGLLPAVFAAPTVASIPFTGFGDASEGSISAPVALSSRSYLVAAEGPDASFGTADDVVLLVNNLNATPSLRALATPYLPDYSGRVVRLSATRALVATAGTDGTWKTADDAVLVLDQLGSGNTVTSVTIGGLDKLDSYSPVVLSSTSAVIATRGPDLAANTADDQFLLLRNLGGTPTTTPLAAPALDSAQSRVTALSPTSFLVASNGPDRALRTADDQVYLFTGVGTANTRTDLNVPAIFQRAPRQSVRLSATRAVIVSAGPDRAESTPDDQVVLLDQLGTANTITPITVPSIHDYGAGLPVALSEATIALVTEGPDNNGFTLDDQVAIITGLGTTNTVSLISVGSTDEDAVSRVVRLSSTRLVLGAGGTTSATINDADDEAVVIDGVGTTNAVTHIPMPGIAPGVTSNAVALSNSAFLINHGGPDNKLDSGGDDEVVLVTGTGNGYTKEAIPAIGSFDGYSAPTVAVPLGRGRAVFISSGPNNQNGTGNDDLMRILSGLPEVRGIQVTKVSVAFNPARPTSPETFSASGAFGTDDPGLLLNADVTVSVGNASQTIPVAAFKRSRTGVYSYSDTKHLNGVLTKVTLDPGKRKFSISGKGVNTGLRSGVANYVPVAIGGFREYLADAVTGRGSTKGVKFP